MVRARGSRDVYDETHSALLSAARRAFLDKGFSAVSLRRIASEVGVTTGAIYGHFSSKEDLLDHVVGPSGEGLCALYQSLIDDFLSRPAAEQSLDDLWGFELAARERIIDFIYDHSDDFLIIAKGSSGTRWETYLDRLVRMEVASSERYGREGHPTGLPPGDVGYALSEVLASFFLQGIFKPLLLGLNRSQAQQFVRELGRFFHGGRQALTR